jgi:hypothetical protein
MCCRNRRRATRPENQGFRGAHIGTPDPGRHFSS